MRPRPSLVACLMLAIVGWCLAGDVSGPEPPGATPNTAPVMVAGKTYSLTTFPSPYGDGKVQRVLTDGYGRLRVVSEGSSGAVGSTPSFSSLSTWKTVSVDTTATGTELVPANTARKLLIVVNNGATACYVGFGNVTSGASASATGGLLLAASGGAITLDGPMVTSQIKAITASGSSVVFVGEGG